ncbi:MAG: hypothetical protein P8R54_07765 [Myxococcota bacterium]|nr:hypothetical protein [Myxococcota bacterium]
MTALALSAPVAVAQEPPAEAAAPEPALARLQAELAAAREESAGHAAAAARLDDLISAVSSLTDATAAEADKLAAVGLLAELQDPRAVPFFVLAAGREHVVLKRALLSAASSFPGDVRIHQMVVDLLEPRQPEAVRLDALIALDAVRVPGTPEILMALAGSRSEPEVITSAAAAQLAANHAEFLAAQGGVQLEAAPDSIAGASVFALTSGVTGSLMLATVGQLGQTDAGPSIGAFGGLMIGTGVGVVYARSNNLTIEQALQYSTATGIGMIYGAQTVFLTEVDQPLYLTTLGSALGSGVGLAAMSRLDPTVEDITETVGAMSLGYMAFSGAARWAAGTDKQQVGAGMVGQSLGGASALFLRDAFSLDRDDRVLISSAGVVGGWLGGVAPLVLKNDEPDGIIQTAIPVSMLAASAVSQSVPIPADRILAADYGFVAGNFLGLGVPLLLLDAPDDNQVAAGALIGGLGGLAAGGVLYGDGAFTTGDASFVAVGSTLITAEASALSYVLSEKTGFDRGGGLILTATGASLSGLGLASQYVDLSPAEPLLVASAAGWGMFYGGLIPVAIGLEGEAEDLVLVITGTSNVFMAAAAISQTDRVGLSPRATVLPQLGGVGGAVIGSLGTALFVPDPQSITTGALIGSVAGVAVGIGMEQRYGSEWLPRAQRLPTVRLASAPAVIDSEESGMTIGIAVEGW